ncbi:MAG: hypothetical protein Kow0099_29790 [Candidatus Abyssubacteria bacterium]
MVLALESGFLPRYCLHFNSLRGIILRFLMLLSAACCLVLSSFPSHFCFAGEKDAGTKLFLQRDKRARQDKRRAVRRTSQEIEEAGHREDSTKDETRIDYKVSQESVRITDSRLTDRKYRAAEIKRDREEAKVEPSGPAKRQESGKADKRRQDFLMEKKGLDFSGL